MNAVNNEAMISAEVRDDQGIVSVWAVIYKPSYQPPDPDTEELPQETVPTVTLLDPDGDGNYSGLYEGFDEVGEYRIVVYAVDVENLQGRPKEIRVQSGTWTGHQHTPHHKPSRTLDHRPPPRP